MGSALACSIARASFTVIQYGCGSTMAVVRLSFQACFPHLTVTTPATEPPVDPPA